MSCGIAAYCIFGGKSEPPAYDDKTAVQVEMNPGVSSPPQMGDSGVVVMDNPEDIEKLEAAGMEIGVE